MPISSMTVLVVGATGSIGRLVVDEALRQGHAVRALVRGANKAHQIPSNVRVIIGDVTRPDTLRSAVNDVDAMLARRSIPGVTQGTAHERANTSTSDQRVTTSFARKGNSHE